MTRNEIDIQLNSNVLTHDDLVALSGYTRPSQLKKWMQENGISCFRGNKDNKASTLVTAAESALGIDVKHKLEKKVDTKPLV